MFAFGNEAFWLNMTNAALGLGIFALLVAIVWSLIQEIHSSKHDRQV